MDSRLRRRVPRAVLLAGLLASLLIGTVGSATASAAGWTADSVADSIVARINNARVNRGLRPFRTWGSLEQIATVRAQRNADAGTLSHAIGGNLTTQLSDANVQWFKYGETLAWTSIGYSSSAAQSVVSMWSRSPSHWTLLMSSSFNYIGVGVARRSANGATYVSAVMTESVDHTRPGARMTAGSRSGTTVAWNWTGWDPKLQTHTAGLRNFDVQYRIDSGTWRTIRTGITATGLSLRERPRGHSYGLRVRSRDRRGNLSAWTSELRIWVP